MYNLFKILGEAIFIMTIIIGLGCRSNSEREQGVAQLQRINIADIVGLPTIGDTLLLTSEVQLKYPFQIAFRNGSSTDSVFEYVIDHHQFLLTQNPKGLVNFIATDDTLVVTPEGVHVGLPIHEVSQLVEREIIKEPGWAYHIKMTSGWYAATHVSPESLDSLSPSARIGFLFKR